MREFKLKDYKLGDTIAAIATFPGKSALGIIKVSGPGALVIGSKLFKFHKKKNIKSVKTHTLHYGWIVEGKESKKQRTKTKGEKRKMIDEVLLSVMRKPSTYTKEDIIEISSHGGIAVVNKILELVLKQGARLALPGEFTYRALVGGRIDLLQAESIRGIVDAKSEDVLALATSQLRGDATLKVKRLKEELKELFIQSESAINFPEDELDISSLKLKKRIDSLINKVGNLLEGSREAEILREGLKCVICGKANVGKSTLFNCLLKEERVIVSRSSGTTRDVIEETINIKGVSLRIYDTAGILEPKDLITKKALKKTLKIFSESDLVILVFDGSRRLSENDLFLFEKVKNKNVIFIINKSDLIQRLDQGKIPKDQVIVKMSALEGKGLGDLEEAVYRMVYKKGVDRENIVFLSQHQRHILQEVGSSLNQIRVFLEESRPIDFINIELKICLDNIGRLSGEVFSEEILESIFSNFCIGK
ncbi:MAG: tRNA uridine-5-carboxymethylaminomethyl(34) synthesis GTPase MnmE [Candidatus Omnitrophica bacterium]|nr:tRNA uridine-5-carboxymethylaminomethyl(34) synthesis GTPase MnmE [Candidatus Omnitrophota bacterium]